MKLEAVPIETERLRLRQFEDGDFEGLFAYRRLPEVTRFLYRDPPDETEVRDYLQRAMTFEFEKADDTCILAIELKEGPKLIGDVGLRLDSRLAKQGELAYTVDPAYAGRGYATESVGEILSLGFGELGLHRIYARIDTLNRRSISIVEHLGMRREAHFIENYVFKGRWADEFIYAMLSREWQSASTRRRQKR